MTIDSSCWIEMCRVSGPCMRPGGIFLTERALAFSNLPHGSRIIDVGCGAGGSIEHLEQTGAYRFIGLDCSKALLMEATPRLTPGHLVCGQAEELPFKDGLFDALLCECVLSILSDRMAALQDFSRVTRDGGFLIVSDVFKQNGSTQKPTLMRLEAQITDDFLVKEEIADVLEGLGFTILLWEDHRRLLKEFLARMILSNACPQDDWLCRQGRERSAWVKGELGYFLMIAQKESPMLRAKENREEGDHG
jgi:arsenite methyltransferase